MSKNLISEYLICSVANIGILDRIFTFDFLQTILVLISQLFITLGLKLVFEFINKKIKRKENKK